MCQTGRRKVPGGEWDSLCDDMKQLILSQLSRADLARPAGTCREFREVFWSRAAEERAALIALAKETYGEDQFNGTVRAIQRTMRGLEPFPSITGKQDAHECFVVLSAAGEPRRATWEVKDTMWREEGRLALYGSAFSLMATDLKGSAWWQHRVQVDVSRHTVDGVQVDVVLWRRCAPSIGVLLAICTEDPKALLPCMQSPVTMCLSLHESPVGAWEEKAAQEVLEPVRMLAQFCTFKSYQTWHGKHKFQKWQMSAHPRSVLETLNLRW